MPGVEQLLYADLHHFSIGHCSYSPSESNLGSSQSTDVDDTRTNEKTNGQHQEFWRVSRDTSSCKSSVHSILW